MRLSVYALGDFHVGHSDASLEKLAIAAEVIQNDANEKRVYLLGDLIEAATKTVGDSVFWQELSIDEQVRAVTGVLSPLRGHIAAYCLGNHEYRLLKDYDLNIAELIAADLGCPVYVQCYDEIDVGGRKYRLFATHGFGGAKRLETAISKVYNDTKDILADIVLYGHLHYLFAYKRYVNDMGKPLAKVLACTGHFFDGTPAYAQMRLYPPTPPGFVKLEVSKRRIQYRTIEL